MRGPATGVTQEAEAFSAVLHPHHLNRPGVARRVVGAHRAGQPLGTIHHLELAAVENGLPVVRVVGGPGAFVGEAGLGQVHALANITRVGKGGNHRAGRAIRRVEAGGAADVVTVKMGEKHHVHILRFEAGPPHVADEPLVARVQADEAPLSCVQLIPVAHIHQNQAGIGLDQQTAGVHGNQVALVGHDDLLPEDARHQSKETAAIDLVQPVVEDMAAGGADFDCVGHDGCFLSCSRRP